MMRARHARVIAQIAAFAALASAFACTRSKGTTQTTQTQTSTVPVQSGTPTPPDEVVETAFDGGFKNGWMDWGWAPRETNGPTPARVRFSNWGGWILAKPGLKGTFGSLVFRVKVPKGEAEFLEVRVESGTTTTFPRIKVGAEHRVHVGDDWDEIKIPMFQLDPDDLPFDRIIIRAFRTVPDEWTSLDKVGFTKGEAVDAAARLNPASYSASGAKQAQLGITCTARASKISPQIYGIAYNFMNDGQDQQWKMGAAIRRWGGNPTTRYNWQIHAWNLANDWFHENVGVPPYTKFLADDEAHGVMSALSVPIMGWVAKDTSSMGFPVSVFGPQERTDPYKPEAGNGVRKDGSKITPGPQTRTSVAITPDFVKKWIETIRQQDAKSGKRSIVQYILDNEPALWQSTHRDVHPEPLGYDELLERTIQYGTAIRQADPDAVIAGPAEWGWLGLLYSGKDQVAGFTAKPDRKAHGDVPLVEWYLQKLREHEQKTGVRILDVLDMHYYPQSEGVYGGGQGGTDPHTNELRIRSTRSLWDRDYVDESWIKEKLYILPRAKEWIAKNYPGRGLSVGEWSWGGEGHMSGAIATAEVLGRFGQFGVTSAYYWTFPPADSPTILAFLAYRNFDGKGGRFLDWSLPTTVPPPPSKGFFGGSKDEAPAVTLFASRDEEGKHLVAIAINPSPDVAVAAKIDVSSCGPVAGRQAYAAVRGSRTLVSAPPSQDTSPTIEQILPPYSITVMDIKLAGPMPGAVEK